jgi:DNA-binding MarR family transcriptional regulator
MRHPTLILKQSYLAMRRAIDDVVRDLGLTGAQFDVLQQLLHEDCMEHRELQRRLAIASPTLTVTIDAMVASGHVVRERDAVDRRVVRLRLGPAAIELVKSNAFREAGDKVVLRMFEGFEVDDRTRLLASLNRIARNFEAH